MQFPVMSRDKTMLEQILLLERVSDEYTKAAGQQVAPDILLSTLVRILPKDVQRHVQLTMSEDATYAQVREQVLAHERISSTWSKDRVMADISGTTALGTVTSYAVGDGGAAPMEVNQIKGKAKGKGKFGSGKAKGKGKPVIPKGKGKGKPSDKGKGKGYSSKGYGDGSSGSQKGAASGKIDANTCAYCGKAGHWARDCRKKKADSQVRQVEESDPKDTAHSSGTAAASSTAIRAVQMLEPSTSPAPHVHFEDLTVFSKSSSSSSPFNLCVVSEVCSVCAFPCVKFDMTCTDGDSQWTVCPELKSCCCSDVSDAASFQHVRVVIDELSDDSFMPCDVILDSGADISVLPLHYSGIGEVGPAPDTTFVDAQGCPLAVESTRIATLQFGNVAFREKFIIADVTTPLVALGHIIRAGWSLVQHDGGPCLVKDDKSIEVLYKNNSLCAKGTISMISQVEPKDALPSVRAVQLGIALRTLRPGWNKLNPQLFAIKTTLPKFVDTTTTPSDELVWLRTTLVCREGGTWEVVEFCEAIGDLPAGIDEEIHFPRTVLEVVTLAHKYALPAEDLGFYMPGYGLDIPEQSSVPSNLVYHNSRQPQFWVMTMMTSLQDMPRAFQLTCLRNHLSMPRMVNHWLRTVRLRQVQMRQLCMLMELHWQLTAPCVHFELDVFSLACRKGAANVTAWKECWITFRHRICWCHMQLKSDWRLRLKGRSEDSQCQSLQLQLSVKPTVWRMNLISRGVKFAWCIVDVKTHIQRALMNMLVIALCRLISAFVRESLEKMTNRLV